MSDDGNETQETSAPVVEKDPVRKWTLIILAFSVFLLGWYLVSDRITPYTSQARVNAIVVPVASEISGTVNEVAVVSNQLVKKGDLLFGIDKTRYELDVETAEANLDACLLYTSDAADDTSEV